MPSQPGSGGSGSELCEGQGGGHAGCRGDEPRTEVGGGVFGVAFFFRENECSYESADLDAEVEERVAVSGEGYGFGRRSRCVRGGYNGRLLFVVFGEEVVRRAGAVGRGECG